MFMRLGDVEGLKVARNAETKLAILFATSKDLSRANDLEANSL